MKKLLVTAALPYANGSIHLGHLVEYIQTDIWVRYWRLRGRDVIYLCADDTHGTPIMLHARGEGIPPEALIARMQEAHRRDFQRFDIEFDYYGSTHSEENRALTTEIYGSLLRNGHLIERAIEQAYCPQCAIFLPDRFLRGDCPHCGAAEQYGDNCEKCAHTYSARDLNHPRCAQCGGVPEWRKSNHIFFRVSDFASLLEEWTSEAVPVDVRNKLQEWFQAGLRDWDISRDAPYFGFEIPERPGQYFYVWLDAPIGYMATTAQWCQEHGIAFDSYWRSEEAEIVHFIGKDIVYFHALFWPALLQGAGFRLPDKLAVHGFLTVDDKKMSKSRGTFITAAEYLKYLDPQYLRYYFASRLSARAEDLNLSLNEFATCINAEMMGKIANIASRVMKILHTACADSLSFLDTEGTSLVNRTLAQREKVARLYEEREFAAVTRVLLEIAGDINVYLEAQVPWLLVQSDPKQAGTVCTAALNAFRILITLAQPILPEFGRKTAAMLGLHALTWEGMAEPLENQPIAPYVRLAERIPPGGMDASASGAAVPLP